MIMNKKLRIAFIILSPICWFLLHASVSLFLFYWRIANEPGVSEPANYFWTFIIIFIIGFCGTLIINIFYIVFKEKRAWIAWVLNFTVTILYVPLGILTLLMIV